MGTRKNGRARRRHACLPRARPFSLSPYFQAPAAQARVPYKETWSRASSKEYFSYGIFCKALRSSWHTCTVCRSRATAEAKLFLKLQRCFQAQCFLPWIYSVHHWNKLGSMNGHVLLHFSLLLLLLLHLLRLQSSFMLILSVPVKLLIKFTRGRVSCQFQKCSLVPGRRKQAFYGNLSSLIKIFSFSSWLKSPV